MSRFDVTENGLCWHITDELGEEEFYLEKYSDAEDICRFLNKQYNDFLDLKKMYDSQSEKYEECYEKYSSLANVLDITGFLNINLLNVVKKIPSDNLKVSFLNEINDTIKVLDDYKEKIRKEMK